MGDNLVLYDWLSFSLLDMQAEDVIDLLHLKTFDWEIRKGFYGYRWRYFNQGGISVHYDGSEDQGVLVEITGSGCRYFETNSELSWNTLFFVLEHLPEHHRLHFTRLDIAFDDHEGILPLDQIVEDTLADCWVSPFRWAEVQRGAGENHGCTVYFGSPQSETRIRIYDKAAERHAEDEGHWVRVELQLRRDRAAAFIARREQGLTDLFCGVLLNYLRFVQPSDDSNKSRWQLTEYWDKLLGAVSKVRLFSAPGLEYNRDRLNRFVYDQTANAVYTALVLDYDSFLDKITALMTRSGGLPEKYYSLLKQEFLNNPVDQNYIKSDLQDRLFQCVGQLHF